MNIRDMSIVFGKVNPITTLFSGSFEDDILSLVKSRKVHRSRDFYWVFGNLLLDNKTLAGRFGKYKVGEKDVVYDTAKSEFREEIFDKVGRAFYSNFVIYLPSRIIAFEDRKPGISISGFINAFHRFSLDAGKEFEVKLLVEAGEIYEILDRFSKVTKASIRVTPANPHDEPEFRKIQKILEEANADKGTFELEGKDGLEVRKSIIGEGIEMSGKGYCDLRITGESEGRIKKVTSKDKTLRTVLQKVADETKEIAKRFSEEIKKRL
jgi:hypothetical protein